MAAASMLGFATSATAQDAWPAKPIHFISPYPPGGGTDTLARFIAQRLNQAWGQPVVVENRPGGNTVIGTQIVAKAAPDCRITEVFG